jgi:hypothetical protein
MVTEEAQDETQKRKGKSGNNVTGTAGNTEKMGPVKFSGSYTAAASLITPSRTNGP